MAEKTKEELAEIAGILKKNYMSKKDTSKVLDFMFGPPSDQQVELSLWGAWGNLRGKKENDDDHSRT